MRKKDSTAGIQPRECRKSLSGDFRSWSDYRLIRQAHAEGLKKISTNDPSAQAQTNGAAPCRPRHRCGPAGGETDVMARTNGARRNSHSPKEFFILRGAQRALAG